MSDVVSGAFKQDKKIWEKAIDPNNFVDLSPETALLTALSTGVIKGTQNLKTSPLASFEGMTDLEKVILSTNMEGLPDALRFISSDASFAFVFHLYQINHPRIPFHGHIQTESNYQ